MDPWEAAAGGCELEGGEHPQEGGRPVGVVAETAAGAGSPYTAGQPSFVLPKTL